MHDPFDPAPPQRRTIVVPVLPAPPPEPAPPPRRWRLAIGLFVATCFSTFFAYSLLGGTVVEALTYSVAVIGILTCHELGHFFQAQRYRVLASLPYFIPMPLPPLGTLGAVIAMGGRIPHRRALFDIGITGPLAGLPPAILCAAVGIYRSEVRPVPEDGAGLWFGDPLLIQFLTRLIHGEIPDGSALYVGPLGLAGWVGIFITALNLIPIGQLDGGHVLYALLGRRAHPVAIALFAAAVAAVIALRYWHWSLLLALLLFFGPRHPPTGDDTVPIDRGRLLLGWLTLAFVVLGFTPVPWTVEMPTP